MTESTYSVIFRGDLEPGYTVADVKANFARLFKAGPDTVEKLFSGRPLAIKKGLSQAQAEQLQATLSRHGALSSLKPEGEPQQAAPAPSPAPQLQPPAAEKVDSETGLSLAPMEGYLLKDHERAKVDPVQVPVSHLSLKPAGGNLVEASEQQAPPPVQVQVPNWQLGSHITGKASFKLPD
ncbi:hypothetical protein [Microbulbifer sp. HZ11]|uniref:hypothetical protein n=1 Tax=unclassified Microbulbifer TaxID=2619833 RepID=UPI0005BBDA29|nr:hypothetical protein [Microbulbifer sp. HZ11]